MRETRRYGYFQTDIDASAKLDAGEQEQQELFRSKAYKDSVEALVAAIKEKGLQGGMCGIDEMGITPECMDQLKSALPDAKFQRCFSLFERVRSINTSGEVEILRTAAWARDSAIEARREG